MKASILSSFLAFELTPEEELQAFDYNDLQVAGIQNMIAASAEDILKTTLEVDQLSLDAQKKLSYTRGQMDILKYLLARADALVEERKQAQFNEQANSNNSPL